MGNVGFSFMPGTVTPAGRFITAIASDSNNNTSEFSQAILVPCLAAVTPSSAFFAGAGGEGSITVTGSAGCSWIATSNAAWINIRSATSGSSNGFVTYVVRDNFSLAARQGTINIGGLIFTITQEGQGAATCPYSISPQFTVADASGGSGSINVTTDPDCAWEAESNVGWITIASGCCGTGNGAVSYLVAPNASGTARKGAITIAGKTFAIKQTG